ncbi:MAG: ABC transporter permease [Bacteroidota bacterium]
MVYTILYSIVHLQINSVYIRADLIEYWIAVTAWCSILVLCCRSIFQKGTNKPIAERLFLAISPASMPNRATVKKSSFGIYSLLLFMGIALLGPFIVPLDPTNQGDLETTRFLPPLQSATASEVVPRSPSARTGNGSIERTLSNVNNDLLEKRVYFTRSEYSKTEHKGAERNSQIVFLFGTDALGRDVFSRVIYGTRISLGIGVIVALLSMIIGLGVGFLSGLMGGMADKFVMRGIDVLLSIPSLVLIISLFSVLGGSIQILIIVLAVSGWMGVARLVRGEVLKLRELEFIHAAKLLGVSSIGIIRNHLLPNIMPTIVTASVLQLVNSIMGEAALSFLGLGIQPPTPSWGNMIGESVIYLGSAWWIGVFPGIALSLFAMSSQLIADGIQECQK